MEESPFPYVPGGAVELTREHRGPGHCIQLGLCTHDSPRILGCTSVDTTSHGPCGTAVFTTEKIPRRSGLVMFKGQLYTSGTTLSTLALLPRSMVCL